MGDSWQFDLEDPPSQQLLANDDGAGRRSCAFRSSAAFTSQKQADPLPIYDRLPSAEVTDLGVISENRMRRRTAYLTAYPLPTRSGFFKSPAEMGRGEPWKLAPSPFCVLDWK